MSDYGDPINVYEFKYNKPVYYNSNYTEFKDYVITKLTLNSQNFNFDLAEADGSDFRLTTDKNGFAVLKMWVAYWSVTNRVATIFFEVPDVGVGDSYTFQAYWGNTTVSGVSDPASISFLFYEDFSSSPLSSSKWTGDISNTINEYGYIFNSIDELTTITDPLENKYNWCVEAGVYAELSYSYSNDNARAMGFQFEGTENDFYVDIMQEDRMQHNIIVPGGTSYSNVDGTYMGFEPSSQQDIHIHYYEPNDAVTFKLQHRNTYDDVSVDISRKVEGDTRPNNIMLRGWGSNGPRYVYINWLIVREYDDNSLIDLDGSELYIPYENIPHQNIDFRDFGADLTSVLYQHESSLGGNPYKLSDEGYDSNTNIWISDDNASISGAAVTIHTGWSEDVTSRSYKHYDSDHVYYYNASKLSDDNDNRMGRDFWHCTTTSGWSAIKFSPSVIIGSFRVKATSNLGACPKDFSFYGSNYNPDLFFSQAKEITTGTFEKTEDWQSRVVVNTNKYKYYILYIENTQENENIEIQEWEMMSYIEGTEKRYPTQLRLHPALYSDYEYNFPKYVTLAGSLDGVNWTTLISQTNTYTPFIEHYIDYGYWQHYTFDNEMGFYSFRVTVSGNWGASDNKVIIGEWSIHELVSEAYTHRILSGTSNNIQQIWTSPTAGLDDDSALIYIANERINKVLNDKLVGSEELPSYYEDFNIV